MKVLNLLTGHWYYVLIVTISWIAKGWALYKQGKYKEALEFMQKSWDLRPVYDRELFLHLEAAKKAVAGQKN